jgi:hypothetical protein
MLTDKNNCPRTRRRFDGQKKIVRGQRLSAKPTSVVHGQRGRVRCPQKLQDPTFFLHEIVLLLILPFSVRNESANKIFILI